MADEKKKDGKNGVLIAVAGVATLGGLAGIGYAYENGLIKLNSGKNKPIVGTYIEVNEGSQVYRTITDAINETNGKTPYYNSSISREVITAYYQVDGAFVKIEMKEDYQQKEKEILDKNGLLVGILTTVDFETKSPEAYYNASSIKSNVKETQESSQDSKQESKQEPERKIQKQKVKKINIC